MKDNKNIANFSEHTQKEEKNITVSLPTAKEVAILKAANDKYIEDNGKDAMIPTTIWDGSAWKAIFEQIIEPTAQEIDCDAWDVFAVLIAKFRGAEFIETKDGISLNCKI